MANQTSAQTSPKSRTTLMVAVAGLLVLLIAAPVLFVKFVMTPEWIDENVLPEIEARIGREIEFKKLRLGFRGLQLEKLVVSESSKFARSENEVFARLDNLVLAVDFWPLLQRKVVIREIVIGDPLIIIHRNEDGVFNFSDLTGPETDAAPPVEEKEEEEETETKTKGKAGAPLLSIVADDIRLQNARFIFIDEIGGGRSQIELRRVLLTASGVSFEEPFDVDATLEILPGDADPLAISVEGTIDLAQSFFSVDASFGDIDVDALMAVFASDAAKTEAPKDEEAPAPLDPGFNGKLGLHVDSISYSGIEATDAHVQASLSAGKLELSKVETRVFDGLISASGAIDLTKVEPGFNVSVVLDRLQLASLAALAETPGLTVHDGDLVGKLIAVGSGRPNIDALLAGKLKPGEKFLVEGVRLSDANLDWTPGADNSGLKIPALNISVPALYLDRPSDAQIDATIKAGQAKRGVIKIVTGIDVPAGSIELHVHADALDLDAITKALATSSQSDASAVADTDSDAAALDLGRWKLKVTADIDELRAASMEGTELHAAARVASGKVHLDAMAMNLAGGRVDSSGTAELAAPGLPFDSRLDVRNIAIEKMLAPYWDDAWGQLAGTIGVKGGLAGRAADSNTLDGSVVVSLSGTSFADAPIMQSLATITGISELTDLKFENSGGRISVGEGKLTTKGFALRAADHRVVFVGEMGLDGTIDMEVSVGVSPNAKSQPNIPGGVASLFKSKDGWTDIPVAITGTTSKPLPTIPKRALADKAKEAIPALIGEKLGDKLGEDGAEILKGIGALFGGGE
ncbi:MAG: hypothetical protein ACI8TX_001409 [Hyphomicrobiaceae bacterium]|jgi:uncharacterized protein involved in outer membrane biogenesis